MELIQGLAQRKMRRLSERTISAVLGAHRDGRRGRGRSECVVPEVELQNIAIFALHARFFRALGDCRGVHRAPRKLYIRKAAAFSSAPSLESAPSGTSRASDAQNRRAYCSEVNSIGVQLNIVLLGNLEDSCHCNSLNVLEIDG